MAFNQFLKQIVGDRAPSLLDMHKAFSTIATLYIEDSLNLVNEAALSGSDKTQVLARADVIFGAWEHEIASLKSAILTVSAREHTLARPGKKTRRVL